MSIGQQQADVGELIDEYEEAEDELKRLRDGFDDPDEFVPIDSFDQYRRIVDALEE